ncbi:hypothetical protein [Paenibacillus gorillae]|uniref:hypothetical protein n=1 Tax=Paenibacillus gorillae TaxID=1243662 RepID=UPI0005AB2528|nr:hypothetical protein [Paenibacillus gorillae]
MGAFTRALSWHIPWAEAVEQLRQCLPVVLARFPALAPHLSEWLETVFTHVQTHQSPIVHLELGGEHLPKEERNAADQSKEEALMTAQIVESKVSNSAPSKKQYPKRPEKLYVWLLSILSGALFLGTLLLTASLWLAVLAFLLPAICIIVWELLIRSLLRRKDRVCQF